MSPIVDRTQNWLNSYSKGWVRARVALTSDQPPEPIAIRPPSLSVFLSAVYYGVIMATYKEIQDYVKAKHGFVPKTCWIADIKNQHGIPMRKAPNRQGEQRVHPCPSEKRSVITQSLRELGVI